MSNNKSSEELHTINMNTPSDRNWRDLDIMKHTPEERSLLKKIKGALKGRATA